MVRWTDPPSCSPFSPELEVRGGIALEVRVRVRVRVRFRVMASIREIK